MVKETSTDDAELAKTDLSPVSKDTNDSESNSEDNLTEVRPLNKRQARIESNVSAIKFSKNNNEPSRLRKLLIVIFKPVRVVINFLQEVYKELKLVVWPTRSQLANYTAIVIVFVVFIVALVALLDLGFARLILTILG